MNEPSLHLIAHSSEPEKPVAFKFKRCSLHPNTELSEVQQSRGVGAKEALGRVNHRWMRKVATPRGFPFLQSFNLEWDIKFLPS